MPFLESEFKDSILKSFFNQATDGNDALTSRVVCNRHAEKVGDEIKRQLRSCRHYDISVAFITEGGFQVLFETLKEIDESGEDIHGRILTTDYLTFTQPKALVRLNQLKHVEVRLFRANEHKCGFHTKGFIFRDKQVPDLCRMMVGSANLTRDALYKNNEWNLLVVSSKRSAVAQTLQSEFNGLWDVSTPLHFVLEHYEKEYRLEQRKKRLANQYIRSLANAVKPEETVPSVVIMPNPMQKTFIENLMRLICEGRKRALLVAATGTGKTYAAALAMREIKADRVLFIVHREQIAKKSKESFKDIFGDTKSMGLLSGNSKEIESDFVFATMQTLSKDQTLASLDKNAFTHIIIDEAHHVGAKSYNKIINHFKPNLWLGMTATPNRNDTFNVFEAFDNNVAYTITLQKALENEFLCPFHYYGLSDIYVEEEKQQDPQKVIKKLTTDERVSQILKASRAYGYSGDRVKALVFCSRVEECEILAQKMKERNVRAIALSGQNTQEDRERAQAQLEMAEKDGAIDYIFSVDIFNEGVDIPGVNQIILMRPTESPIIFVQQLGRGLRHAPDKEFLVVIDFIANYQTNYLIPVALTGDRSYNKDNMRRLVRTDGQFISGGCTVEFDKISRERILKSIDEAKTNSIKLIMDSYKDMKYELGRIPTLMDFERLEGLDPLKIIKSFKSYTNFLIKKEPDYLKRFTKNALDFIQFVSTKYAAGKRMDEVLLLKAAIYGEKLSFDNPFSLEDINQFNLKPNRTKVRAMVKHMQSNYVTSFKRELFVIDEEGFSIQPEYQMSAMETVGFKEVLDDVFTFTISRFEGRWAERYKDTDLVLNQKYTYEDVCRLLNWDKNINGQNIGGYKYDAKTKTLPVFINYHKDEDAIAYEDRFQTPSDLMALSKKNRDIDSPDANHIYKRDGEQDNRIYLFVRKNKDDEEAKEFYFLGEIQAQDEPRADKMPTGEKVFTVHYHLDNPVNAELYEYITKE